MLSQKDTIFALSSGRPPAAIAVVRVSGPRAREALLSLAGRIPQPRQATLVRLRSRLGKGSDAVSGSAAEAIDDALVLWFPGPRSETGEDMAEFQLHGGYAVIAAVLSALGQVEGLRPAEPGEFTRRAFQNGKLDLTRVEGLADLIAAETEAQRRQAFQQLAGMLGGQSERWRERLTEALAMVEAVIDFPDERDVSEQAVQAALKIARELEGEISGLLSNCHRGERLREGLTVAVAGPVNVGKSSIVNRLAKRSAAIVSPYAGTTRDIIEVHFDLGGFPVTVLDTAGIREAGDPVEQEGVRRARARAEASDLVLWLSDATLADSVLPPADLMRLDGSSVWLVSNKIDLAEPGRSGEGAAIELDNAETAATGRYRVSAQTGAGFDELVSGLAGYAERFFAGSESGLITRERHRVALLKCVDALHRAQVENDLGREDIVAEELRLAARALARLVGRVDVENVLDVIFRDFCVGK